MYRGGFSWGQEPTGEKVNLIEFSEEKVHSILKEIPPIGDFTDRNNGCALTLVNLKEMQNAMVVKTLSEFLEPFDVVWKRYRTPPNASVDIKELIAQLQKQTVAAVEHSGQSQ